VPKSGRLKRTRRTLGTAALAWDIWWRLPPYQRRFVLGTARRHGPWLVKRVYGKRRRKRRH
jgi:hypothetical protein